MVLNQIKNVFDRTQFLWEQVETYLEDIEDIRPKDATEEHLRELFNFFDRMIKEYNMRSEK